MNSSSYNTLLKSSSSVAYFLCLYVFHRELNDGSGCGESETSSVEDPSARHTRLTVIRDTPHASAVIFCVRLKYSFKSSSSEEAKVFK